MPDSQVFYAERQGFHGLRFVGRIGYVIGPSLESFLKKICTPRKVQGFLVDLRETESIDSTSLGLLVRLAKWTEKNGSPRVSLLSTRKDINELLFAIGFDEIFDLVDENAYPVLDEIALQLTETPDEQVARTVLDAHRSLVALSDENRVRFEEVVNLLELELDGRHRRSDHSQ